MSVEFSIRLVLFYITVGCAQAILDMIVLLAWRDFVRSRMQSHAWSVWWYRVPMMLGVVMFFVFPLAVYLRQNEVHPSLLSKILHRSLTVWYMPKIAIVAGLVGYWIMKWIDKRFSRVVIDGFTSAENGIVTFGKTVQSAWNQALVKRVLPETLWQQSVHLPKQTLRTLYILLFQPANTPESRANTDVCVPPRILQPLSINDELSPGELSPGELSPGELSPKELSRRAFLEKSVKIAGYALAATPVAVLGADAVYTLYDFQVHRVTVPVRSLPRQFEGLTIAQLSDLHAGSFFSEQPMQEARRITESLKPDMVVITGDWVNWQSDELPIILPEIQAMCLNAGKQGFAPLGCWGCLGNHDHYVGGEPHQELLDAVRAAGVNLLVNQNTTFHIDGEHLQLAAIDNVGLRQNFGDIDKALEGLHPEHPTILMAHDPTFWDKKIHGKTSNDISIDLMLAGHTHGGQIGINIFGVELSPASLMYRQCAGLYASEYGTGQHIYVNRGIGTTGIPVRIGIPPEITLLTLTRA
jgi:uncharacterized protein